MNLCGYKLIEKSLGKKVYVRDGPKSIHIDEPMIPKPKTYFIDNNMNLPYWIWVLFCCYTPSTYVLG